MNENTRAGRHAAGRNTAGDAAAGAGAAAGAADTAEDHAAGAAEADAGNADAENTGISADCISSSKLEETGFHYTMSLIQGKYKMFILYTLAWFGVVRFNEMKKFIAGISDKTLSVTLKELESDGLVHREEYPQIPPKVEYSLTGRGRSLMPILDRMCTWGEEHRQDRI